MVSSPEAVPARSPAPGPAGSLLYGFDPGIVGPLELGCRQSMTPAPLQGVSATLIAPPQQGRGRPPPTILGLNGDWDSYRRPVHRRRPVCPLPMGSARLEE
jgi:hypothetical protein